MSTPQLDTVRVNVDGDTVIATLCRPERLNAVAGQLLTDLVTLADWLRDRDDLHFLVLDHDGPVFSAGAHLGEIRDIVSDETSAPARLRANQRLAQDMMTKLSGLDQISFAALRGSAYGAGMAIAMTCDFRVMSDNAIVNLPETNLSMFLTYGSTPRLVKAVGLARAKEMILFAQDWTAEQCLAAGAVERVVPEEQVRPTINGMIEVLRQRDWSAIRVAKQVANAAAAVQFGDMVMSEPELVAATLTGGDIAARLDSFLNRRR
jgi:enoyl-CoA hydratase/carnithine racemase